MYESFKMPLASKKVYHQRVIKTGTFALVAFSTALSIGMLGYHYLVGLEWVDSFMNASMILGGMGPVAVINDTAGKIFAGCYALFSGITFLSSMAIFLSPIIHRILHKFHVDVKDDN